MNDPFPVVYPARHGETAWSLTGRHTGKKKRRRHADVVVEALVDALNPADVVIGGGSVKLLKKPPPRCRAGDNANAFIGGFRLWEGWDLHQIAAWKKDQLNRSPKGAYVIQ